MCSQHCADWHDVMCRPGSPDAACTQIIEQGLAAEHALDMRKAIICFEVFILVLLNVTPDSSSACIVNMETIVHMDTMQRSSTAATGQIHARLQRSPIHFILELSPCSQKSLLFFLFKRWAVLTMALFVFAGSDQAASKECALSLYTVQAVDRLHIPGCQSCPRTVE